MNDCGVEVSVVYFSIFVWRCAPPDAVRMRNRVHTIAASKRFFVAFATSHTYPPTQPHKPRIDWLRFDWVKTQIWLLPLPRTPYLYRTVPCLAVCVVCASYLHLPSILLCSRTNNVRIWRLRWCCRWCGGAALQFKEQRVNRHVCTSFEYSGGRWHAWLQRVRASENRAATQHKNYLPGCTIK